MHFKKRLKSALQLIIGGHVVTAGFATFWGNEKWYRDYLMPAMQLLGPERAHWFAVKVAKYGLVPHLPKEDHPILHTQVLGKSFSNPIGLAAGFDKNGEAVDSLFRLGFGFVEVGSITPKPQPGNAKPRVFRLKEDKAIINRYGFNSDGHEAVYQRLKSRKHVRLVLESPDPRAIYGFGEGLSSGDLPTMEGWHRPESGILGINLGKNKETSNDWVDYVEGIRKFEILADYIVINVSSPNTPNLRGLQAREKLEELIDHVLLERARTRRKPPILLKIAPDLTEEQKADIAAVVLAKSEGKGGIDGLIVSNTTTSRPASLVSRHRDEVGGLSGQPLKDLSTRTIRDMYRLTRGKLPIIGVGGVSSGKDAYEKIRAGASLVQVYTAMAYDGPPVVHRIKTDLVAILQKEGFTNVSEAVGADVKKS